MGAATGRVPGPPTASTSCTSWLRPLIAAVVATGPVVVLGAGGRMPVGVALADGEPRELVLSSRAAIRYEGRGGDCHQDGVRCVDLPAMVVPVPTERNVDHLWRSVREAAGTIVQAVQHRCP